MLVNSGCSSPKNFVSAVLMAAVCLFAGALGPVAAQSPEENGDLQETHADRYLLGLSAGVIDFTRRHETVEVGADIHFRPVAFFQIRPQAGLGITADNTYFVFAGARREFRLKKAPWLFDVSFGVTYYEKGDGKELGQELEFRSGLDFLRQLRGGGRIGLGVYHLSNAGFSEVNPGTNSVLLRWVVPVG